jgi:hypothetical protein
MANTRVPRQSFRQHYSASDSQFNSIEAAYHVPVKSIAARVCLMPHSSVPMGVPVSSIPPPAPVEEIMARRGRRAKEDNARACAQLAP